MTIEEAIELIKLAQAEVEWEYPMNYAVAFEEAIKALEKQIPKKVSSAIDRTWGKDTIQPVCPSCDYYLPHYQWIGDGKRVNYCETCGQAIDWSEE